MAWRIAAFLLVCVAASQANFAAAPGFSGRVADCSACHRPPLLDNTAAITLDGLPNAWESNATYGLRITINGGPASIPTGPQAGFELEVLAGSLRGDADKGVRSFHDRQATYTEVGVFQREWRVEWTAPGLERMPAPVTLWLAGLAANGNHNTQLNTSDLGEHGDSVTNITFSIPPAASTMEAWRGIPLLAPVVDNVTPAGTGHLLEGRMPDPNATMLELHDGAKWVQRDAGPYWRLRIEGTREVLLRAGGSQRLSPPISVDLETGHTEPASHVRAPKATTPGPWPVLSLLVALWRRA